MSDPIVYNTFNKYIKAQHNPSDGWHIFAVNRFVQLLVANNVWNIRHISVTYRRTCGVVFNNGNFWNVMFDHVSYWRPCFTIKLSVFGPDNAYMGHWTGSSLDQIMACLLPGVKPLLEPMTTYTRLQPQEQISMKFPFTYYIFHFPLKNTNGIVSHFAWPPSVTRRYPINVYMSAYATCHSELNLNDEVKESHLFWTRTWLFFTHFNEVLKWSSAKPLQVRLKNCVKDE